jgi:uncharacterized membrane protein (UPF0182 family)
MGSVLVRRGRRWPLVVAGVLALAALLFTVLSGFLIDLLWYREIGQQSVFWTSIRTRVLLGIAFGLVFFIGLVANLLIARRFTPEVRVLTPEEEAIDRLRDLAEPYIRWLVPVAAALIALLVGIRAAAHWQAFLQWSSSTDVTFDAKEQLFGRDPAFYVFTLPWMRYLQSWTFSALVGITVLTAAAHLYNGGIRPQARSWSDKVSPAVRAHLSVLIGLIMLSKAWGYYLGRFGLLTSSRGVVEGASYTDVNAQLPALTFLAIVAVICAVIFFVNIRLKLWSLPVIAVALLGLTSLLLGTAYPAFVQRFRVDPQELQREREYIDRNIAATRQAFGLDVVEERPIPTVDPTVTPEDLVANAATIDNVRLWRPEILLENFEAEQRLEPYYHFNDVDVDRYEVAGETRVLMVSAREVSQSNIPGTGGTWQNLHLVYTHGYGVVGAQVNAADSDGGPAYSIEDIPPDPNGVPYPDLPQIYYGEQEDVDFVVVGTNSDELEPDDAVGGGSFTYDGDGGIRLSNAFVRALFAWRFRDVNLLISGQIDADSRILIHRGIDDRVQRPVPFLSFDSDPYLAVVDGRPTWIWDAYTTSTEYPYSQSIDLGEATGGDATGFVANYIRNSVKATVDAYDGTVTYWADLDEPIIRAWARAFPTLFTDIDEASTSLVEHFRYPENLFQVQSTQFANYHVEDAARFYNKQDFWQIPDDPTQEAEPLEGQTATSSDVPLPDVRPYYLLLQVPGDSTERFQLVVPFVPGQAASSTGAVPNMVAWMAANSDPEGYGDLVALTLPTGQNVDSPGLVLSKIKADAGFSTQQTLLGRGGSKLILGDLLVIPIGDGFLYVEPVFVRSTQRSAVPELQLVVVVNGDTVGLGSTFAEALDQAVVGGEEPPPPGQEPPPGEEPPAGDGVRSLLSEALGHFAAAEEALREGDLATYQRELDLARDLVEEAQALIGQGPTA